MEFRKLKAEEIECRVAKMTNRGIQLLLYKDARCDQNILDETVGSMNWQRHHVRDNQNCIVSIWDKEKGQWIEKEDTGTESRADGSGNEKKGLASDSFKRACFNWGIGRELYTSPFIFISADKYDIDTEKKLKDRFMVSEIKYDDNSITSLKIINQKGVEVFSTNKAKKQAVKDKVKNSDKTEVENLKEVASDKISREQAMEINRELERTNVDPQKIWDMFKVKSFSELTQIQFTVVMRKLKVTPDKVKEEKTNE